MVVVLVDGTTCNIKEVAAVDEDDIGAALD